MSNVAVFNPSQAPAFAKNRGQLSAVAKALAGGGAGAGGKNISIKGGVFRLIASGKEVDAIEERYLDVVIVNAAPKVSRVWYAKAYDGSSAIAPDCWSQDGDKPAADAENPQASTCAACEKNVAGSGQGNSRACRYQQRLAVVLANDMDGDILQLTAPATSVFGKEDGDNRPLQAYARWLTAQNIDPSEVITRMRFDTKSESPKLFFKTMRWLTEDENEVCQAKGATPEAKNAITMTVAKMDKVAAPVEEEAPAPAPKAKKKADPVEESDEEPVVRKEEKKPNAVPAKKSNLAAMVDDWDENE
jgi:hypothetical protein